MTDHFEAPRGPLWRLIGELSAARRHAVQAALAAVVLALATALYPVALELLVSLLVDDAPTTTSRWDGWARWLQLPSVEFALGLRALLVPGFVALVLIKTSSQAVRTYGWSVATQRVVARMRQRLFERLVHQGADFFAGRRSGALAARFGRDIDDVERAMSEGIPALCFDSLKFVALAIVAVVHYPALLTVATAVFVAAVVPIVGFGRLQKVYARRHQEAQAELTHRVVETVGGITEIHTYQAERRESAKFEAALSVYLQVVLWSRWLRAVHSPLMEVVGVAAVLATVAIVGRSSGASGPGEAVGFLLAMVLMYEPLKNLARVNALLIPGLTAAERIYEVTDRVSSVLETVTPVSWPTPPAEAALEGVWFRYDTSGPDVLKGVDLRLRCGCITGLRGASGTGKSTVARLFPRFYDATAGRVVVGGVDVRAVSLSDLRGMIAVVTQDTFLFDRSVADNIAFGAPHVRAEDIRAAARRAQADAFIEALPEGYETLCGERGVRLSGGERQRIAVARAFVKNAPLLILDEPTSALDPTTEAALADALDALMENRAVLLIAHRRALLDRCDEVFELADGRVVAEETPCG